MDDNVSYTFDDEGNPISTELPPPSARKPPAAPRKGRSKQRKLASAGSQESALNNGATPDLATPSSCQLVAKGEEPMTDMFHIDGTGFDVTLSPNLEKIYWESMNPSGKMRECAYIPYIKSECIVFCRCSSLLSCVIIVRVCVCVIHCYHLEC